MNRLTIAVALALSSTSLLLIDSTIKGSFILVLAASVVLLLRRDSAATRHLVWLVALVAMLLIPVFSISLPQWRVLPSWAVLANETVSVERDVIAGDHDGRARSLVADQRLPAQVRFDEPRPAVSDDPTAAFDLDAALNGTSAASGPAAPSVASENPVDGVAASPNWISLRALTLLWSVGVGALVLRLMAARLLLWNCERRGLVIALSTGSSFRSNDDRSDASQSLIQVFDEAVRHLRIQQNVRLVINAERAIPFVWGLWKFRLLLPVDAKDWTREQQRAVLLHELAHIKRRDTLAQLISQIACAVYWFHPLVWLAAWRLHVERERACDDLVLSNGVPASSYAEHLLNVATRLTSSPWNEACGIAMARRSSLNSRLDAVLSKTRNRRTLTHLTVVTSLLLGGVVAVPIALLRAADDAQQSNEGEPVDEETQNEQRLENLVAKAPVEQATDDQPSGGVKLPAGAEEMLRWGKPVNGLRAALSRLPLLGNAKPGYMDFDLVLQNVSDAPIRLVANESTPDTRRVLVRKDGSTLLGLKSAKPSEVDTLLQPGEVTVLAVYPPDETIRDDGRAIADQPEFTFYATMEIEEAPDGAWNGKLRTPETSGDVISGKRVPSSKNAKTLFKLWMSNKRLNGEIPGGQLRSLVKATSNFVEFNPTDGRAPKLAEVLKRMNVDRDWTQEEAVDLLNDVTAIYDSLPKWAMEVSRFSISESIRTGEPLPQVLENAPWGEPHESGLRTAWLLDPQADKYRLNTPLKSRILYHNNGTENVVFRVVSWNQSAAHHAKYANGAEIETRSTHWTTIGQVMAVRLAPGEFTEVVGAGIGVGPNLDGEDWRNTRVGTWVHAKVGDEVTFWPDTVTISGNDGRQRDVKDSVWWLTFITERLEREAPFPNDDDERERILARVMQDLYGAPATAEEMKMFLADDSPDALSSLAKRLAQRSGTKSVFGKLQSGPTKFSVLPIDPEAKHKPYLAIGPGRYKFNDQATLVIVGRGQVMDAKLEFNGDAEAYPIALPEGYGKWAIAWKREMTSFWIAEQDVLRSVDFSNPSEVKETLFTDPAKATQLPKHFLGALQPTLKPKEPNAPADTMVQPKDDIAPKESTPHER